MRLNDPTSAIFEIENDPHLLDFTTTDGIPIWMMARWYILHDVVGGKLLGYKSPEHFRKIDADMVLFLIKAACYNLKNKSKLKDKKVCLYSTNRKTLLDGKYYNRYVDQLYESFSNESVVIEQAMIDWCWPFPRKNEDVYFDTWGRVFSEIKAKFEYKKEIQNVSEMVRYLKDRVSLITGIEFTDKEYNEIVVSVSKLIVVMRNQADWFCRKIDNKTTRIAIIVGAGFSYSYYMNKKLKDMGITSIELQHGYITTNNIMYNYAENIATDSRVIAGLPKYIFTYGEWWSRQMNCPAKKVAIGNPYHDLCIEHFDFSKQCNCTIVVIGIGENTEGYIELTKYIKDNLPTYDVKFRPHPGEKNIVIKKMEQMGIEINLDVNDEIYKTLSETSFVVGEASTVLFEAAGIVKNILVWNTAYTKAYMPNHPFETFETKEDLLTRITNRNTLHNVGFGEELWSIDWNINYRRVIHGLLDNKM